MKVLKLSAIALLAFGLLAFLLRGSVASIKYGNGPARDIASKKIIADRDKTIAQLEDVVTQDIDDPTKQDAAASAILLLGQMRANHAAPLLASHINFNPIKGRWKGQTFRPPTVFQQHPAYAALIQIGLPSVDALLDQAANTDDRKNDPFADYVLTILLGQRPAIALINDAISEAQDEKQKQRLNALITEMRKYPATSRQRYYQ